MNICCYGVARKVHGLQEKKKVKAARNDAKEDCWEINKWY